MEKWIDITGYEGFYQVSDHGNVRSLDRTTRHGNGTTKCVHGTVLVKQRSTNGYEHIVLSKRGKKKICRIHRLVAAAFIPNPDNLPEVNHKNEIKTDNRAENLEWVSHTLNCNHGTRNERTHAKVDNRGANNPMYGRTGAKHPRSKAVIQCDMDGNFITEYESATVAARIIGCDPQRITHAARGITKSGAGYKWQYKSTPILTA